MNSTTDTRLRRNGRMMSRRRFTQAVGLAAAGLAMPGSSLLAAMLRDHRLQMVRHSTFVMGQIANLTIYHSDPAYGRRAVTSIFEEFRRLDGLMSVFNPASDIGRVNAAAGRDVVAVSAETREVVQRAIEVGRHSAGALDITVNPLERLWGFRELARSSRPTDGEVKGALDAVGLEHVAIETTGIGLRKSGMSLDLGGVAVGYALDCAATMLRALEIESALIELSGDYYAIGSPAGSSRGWEIGVLDPRSEGSILETVFIRNQGLSTSGNYASTVVYDARSYGHIFDPERGFPSDRLLSATVIAPSAFEADAYSTALFVGGDRSILPDGSRSILLRT